MTHLQTGIDQLKDDEWLLLTKDSLFWKAKLERSQNEAQENDPSQESNKYSLQIGYGKNITFGTQSDPSQSFFYSSREEGLADLTRRFKEKLKNGYNLDIQRAAKMNRIYLNQADKENNGFGEGFQGKGGDLDMLNLNDSAILGIEHHCEQVPKLLTEDFDEAMLQKQTSQKEEMELLGKRQEKSLPGSGSKGSRKGRSLQKVKQSAQKEDDGEESKLKVSLKTNALTLEEILPSAEKATRLHQKTPGKPSRPQTNKKERSNEFKKAGLSVSNSKIKEADNNAGSGLNSPKITSFGGLGYTMQRADLFFPELAQDKQFFEGCLPDEPIKEAEKEESEPSSPTSKKIEEPLLFLKHFERSIPGSLLYNIPNNNKKFLEYFFVETIDTFVYTEYGVREDMSLEKKFVYVCENKQQTQRLASEIAERCSKQHFIEEESSSRMASIGTVKNLALKPGFFCEVKTAQDNKMDMEFELETAQKELVQSETLSNLQECVTEKKSLNSLGSANQSGAKTIPEQFSGHKNDSTLKKKIPEEKVEYDLGENLKYELLSHSESGQDNPNWDINDLQSKLSSDSSENLRISEYQKYVSMEEEGTLPPRSKNQPLGPSTNCPTALMLLQNYKSTIEVSSKLF